LPVLSFVYIYKLFNRKLKVLLDIHNFGFTLMFRTQNKKIMNFVTNYERYFARKVADASLTVSKGMADEVETVWKMTRVIDYTFTC
jgi:hypothetical protein